MALADGNEGPASDARRRLRAVADAPEAPNWSADVLVSVLDDLPAPITWWDAELRLRFANSAAVDLFEASGRDRLIGRPWLDVVPTSWKQACRKCIAAALDGTASTIERRMPTRSGSSRHVQITFTPRVEGNEVSGFYAVVHDVTHRAMTESVLRRRADELEATAASWQHRANTDQLTGLVNRHHLSQLVNETTTDGAARALMLIDLDGFKDVNDVFGHLAGDEVLVEVAERLRSHVRGPDIVARLGGDEFVVFMVDIADAGHAEMLAQRLIDTLNVPIHVLRGTAAVTVRASIGIAVDTRAQGRPRFVGLLAAADSLMYEAKQSGNQWRSNRHVTP